MQVGHLRNMEKIQAWSDYVILHFWHCANMCKSTETTSNEEALEQMKVQGVFVKSILTWFLDYVLFFIISSLEFDFCFVELIFWLKDNFYVLLFFLQ